LHRVSRSRHGNKARRQDALRRLLVVSLVILVLEDDQSESDVASADDKRDAGDANERQLPAVDEADDGA